MQKMFKNYSLKSGKLVINNKNYDEKTKSSGENNSQQNITK